MQTVLLDTNVIVSGLLSGSSPPGRLIIAWQDGAFVLLSSRAQIDELRRVMAYDHLRTRIGPQQVLDALDNLDANAVIVEPAAGVELSPDLDDNVILATAIAGRADLIVSGDKRHMLALGSAEGVPIVSPAEALSRLSGGSR